MSKLRNRDTLRREAESDRKAKEARAVLESRIEEAMDRWQREAIAGHWIEQERGKILGKMAERVYSTYGAVFV